MHKLISNLILYGNMDRNEILVRLAELLENNEMNDDERRREIYVQIKRLLELATQYGFNDNLWHNYLTYILITNENPFSMTCEKQGAKEGSVNHFALNDFQVFFDLFAYDFSKIEQRLNIDCFTTLSHYRALSKPELMYNKNVSMKVQELSKQLEQTTNNVEFFNAVTDFYKNYGVGMFGLNKAFRYLNNQIIPIDHIGNNTLEQLIGYESQKERLTANTEAFLKGHKANNVLLYGDSGTGKSSSIKALLNRYYKDGLRMVEVYKHQFISLPQIINELQNRHYRFIIFMDDLSFEEFEVATPKTQPKYPSKDLNTRYNLMENNLIKLAFVANTPEKKNFYIHAISTYKAHSEANCAIIAAIDKALGEINNIDELAKKVFCEFYNNKDMQKKLSDEIFASAQYENLDYENYIQAVNEIFERLNSISEKLRNYELKQKIKDSTLSESEKRELLFQQFEANRMETF